MCAFLLNDLVSYRVTGSKIEQNTERKCTDFQLNLFFLSSRPCDVAVSMGLGTSPGVESENRLVSFGPKPRRQMQVEKKVYAKCATLARTPSRKTKV